MAFLVPMCFWRRAEAHDYNGKASRKRAAAGWWRGGMAGGEEGTASQVSLFSYSFLALLSSGIILFASGTSFIKGAPPFSGDGGGPLGPSPDDRPTDEPRLILLLDPAPLAASANPKLVAMIITQAGGGEGGGIEERRLVGGGKEDKRGRGYKDAVCSRTSCFGVSPSVAPISTAPQLTWTTKYTDFPPFVVSAAIHTGKSD